MVTFLPLNLSKANFPKVSSYYMVSLERHLDHYTYPRQAGFLNQFQVSTTYLLAASLQARVPPTPLS